MPEWVKSGTESTPLNKFRSYPGSVGELKIYENSSSEMLISSQRFSLYCERLSAGEREQWKNEIHIKRGRKKLLIFSVLISLWCWRRRNVSWNEIRCSHTGSSGSGEGQWNFKINVKRENLFASKNSRKKAFYIDSFHARLHVQAQKYEIFPIFRSRSDDEMGRKMWKLWVR